MVAIEQRKSRRRRGRWFRIHNPTWRRFMRALARRMPQGLYGRSLLIIVMPMVILQSVIAFVFMERHWNTVTRRLSQAVTQDIAAIIDVLETYPQKPGYPDLTRIASNRLGLSIAILPPGPLPPAAPKPFFSLLDRTLSLELTRQIGRPFWIDTIGRSSLVEIRIKLDDVVLRVFARRSQTYASNSHIFMVWMVGTSIVLIIVAILFLRNQIRPIQGLADAAEDFGMGRPVEKFKPRGAREVRRASQAFLVMRERIERHVEQRTAMLAGVSHDLRTILTRFKLELALFEDNEDVVALRKDVDEMQAMLEAYLAFSRGDGGELPEDTDISLILHELQQEAERANHTAHITIKGEPRVHVRPAALKRCLSNLVGNACRFAERIDIRATHEGGRLIITIDDDGPGIAEDMRDDVFRPFFRLDDARNQDFAGTGLGLAIALDAARSHGGDLTLGDSPLGGLRASVNIPA